MTENRDAVTTSCSALARRGLLRWVIDLERGHGGFWELTNAGKEALTTKHLRTHRIAQGGQRLRGET